MSFRPAATVDTSEKQYPEDINCERLRTLCNKKDTQRLHLLIKRQEKVNAGIAALGEIERAWLKDKDKIRKLEALYKEEQVMRKRHFNTLQDMKGKIRVYCRLRPLTEKEMSKKERDVVASTDEFTVEHTWRDDKVKQHMYNRVFVGNATQEDVFEDTKDLVQSAMDGFNVCIFAYGQTGSGKTFTIYGSENNV